MVLHSPLVENETAGARLTITPAFTVDQDGMTGEKFCEFLIGDCSVR